MFQKSPGLISFFLRNLPYIMHLVNYETAGFKLSSRNEVFSGIFILWLSLLRQLQKDSWRMENTKDLPGCFWFPGVLF